MACGTKLKQGTYHPSKVEPEVTQKFGIPIRDHALRDSMQSHNLSEIKFGHIGGIKGSMVRDKMSYLLKSIYYYNNKTLTSPSPW